MNAKARITFKVDAQGEAEKIKTLCESSLFKGLSEDSRDFLIKCFDSGFFSFAIRPSSSALDTGELAFVSGVSRLLELIATALATFDGEFNVGHNSSLSAKEPKT